MSTTPNNPTRASESIDHALLQLPIEDLHLITQLVLCSGSIKALAATYGVSYPTIRHRLNGVIGRLGDAVQGRTPDRVAALLADLVERGELAGSTARSILDEVHASQSYSMPRETKAGTNQEMKHDDTRK